MATISFGDVKMPRWEPARGDSAMSLAAFVGLPVLAGFAVSFLGQKELVTWYPKLRKPSWQPPAWLFGPVWTTLYILMGTAAWMVWTHGGFEAQKLPLTLYGVQLLLNLAWNPLFFLFHNLDLAFWDALGLVGTLGLTIWSFHKVEPLAATLLLPYLAWAIFATYLTSTLINLNPQESMAGRALEKEVDMRPVGGIGAVKQERVVVKKEE
ncbi:Translocator protein [Coccomyxa sp. Obi]|nr:Translocator protein [Coccomyxa sp. Obi]